MEIIEDKENFLLNRREIKIVVEAEKTPSFEEALNIVSENFKAEKDLIVVNEVKGKFGRNTFLISSFIYKSKEDKEKYEREKKKEKEEAKEEQAQQAQPQPTETQQEQKAEETPTEMSIEGKAEKQEEKIAGVKGKTDEGEKQEEEKKE